MATFEAFLPEVLPWVPGCSVPFAVNAIRNSAREFTERTKIWKQDLGPFNLVAGEPTVLFASMPGLPADTNVARIFHAQRGGQRLYFYPPDWLAEHYNAMWRTSKGTPNYVTQDDENSARFVPYFDVGADTSGDPITMWVALWPMENATTISDVIFQSHKTVIAAGALAQLLLVKGPFFDANLAATKQAEFDSGKGNVSWDAYKGHVRSRVKSRGHYF